MLLPVSFRYLNFAYGERGVSGLPISSRLLDQARELAIPSSVYEVARVFFFTRQ